MTIGDEKVVERWEDWCGGMRAAVDGDFIKYSAYAELAAERDSLRDERDEWLARSLDQADRVRAAESQLAELRGKLEGLAAKWVVEPLGHYDFDQGHAEGMRECGHELRETLAAADGGAG